MSPRSKICLFVTVMLIVGLFSVGVPSQEKPVYLGTAIRTLSNPYHVTWAKGAELFAKSLGWADYSVIQCNEYSSEKQLNDIRALVARSKGNVVFCIDPNESPDVVAIANVLEQAGVYFVTFWNKPDDVKVWEYDHWVSHIGFDNVANGYKTATELFKTFKTPLKGKVVAIQGMLSNTPAIERFQGFLKAVREHPGIELLDAQTANWQRTKAYDITLNYLAAYPQIDGVWCANDDMAMGALEALRARGLAGKVKVAGIDAIPEMIDAIARGEAAATVSPDPLWQGGMGLSIALAAKQGKIKVSELPHSKRQWIASSLLITRDNINDYIGKYIKGTPKFDWNDHFGRWVAELP